MLSFGALRRRRSGAFIQPAFRSAFAFARFATSMLVAAAIVIGGGCATEPDPKDVDPASLGFKHLYMCPVDADVITIGKRIYADECLEACKTVSKTMLGDTAKGCWWLDGRAGHPLDCRLCKTTAPVQNIFINNWAMPLPAPAQ
jgi:hypothetical protein